MITKAIYLEDNTDTEWARIKSRCGCPKRHRTLLPIAETDIIECTKCGATWPLHDGRFDSYRVADDLFETIVEVLRHPAVFGLAK